MTFVLIVATNATLWSWFCKAQACLELLHYSGTDVSYPLKVFVRCLASIFWSVSHFVTFQIFTLSKNGDIMLYNAPCL